MVGQAFVSILTLISHTHVSCSAGTDPASRGGDVTVVIEASADVTLLELLETQILKFPSFLQTSSADSAHMAFKLLR